MIKMTSRRPLHERRESIDSKSPTKNVLNQNSCPNKYGEKTNDSDDENELEESKNEPANAEGEGTDTSEDDSNGQQRCSQSKAQNQTYTQAAEETRPQKVQETGPQRPLEVGAQRRPETVPLRRPDTVPQAAQPQCNVGKTRTNTFSKLLKYSIIIILPLIVYSQYYKSEPQVKTCTFEELKKRAPSQSTDVWKALRCNIEDMLNKKSKSPNVFLFLYTNQSNESEMQKLVNDIALETSKCFGK